MPMSARIAIALAALAAAVPARAAPPTVSVEGDAARLALGSLSFHVMARPAALPRLRIGVGRVGGQLPGLFHRLFDPNAGWVVTEQGAAAQLFFQLRARGSTAFAGSYLRFDRWEWRRDDTPGVDRGSQLFVMPALGYRWFPRASGLYVAPWAGLGVSAWQSGAGRLGAGSRWSRSTSATRPRDRARCRYGVSSCRMSRPRGESATKISLRARSTSSPTAPSKNALDV
jgi:hypothetical protein